MTLMQAIRSFLGLLENHVWISEKEAAQRLYRSTLTLRKLVVEGHLPISFRIEDDGSFQYNAHDVNKLLASREVYN